MKLPLIATSNSSTINVNQCEFLHNSVLCTIALEFLASVFVSNCSFRHNAGGIAIGGQESKVICENTIIVNHESQELLFSLTEANLTLNNISLSNSAVPGVCFTTSTEVLYNVLVSNSKVANISASMPLFSSIGGNLTLSYVRVKNITSEAEIVVFSHQNAFYTV